MNRVGWGKPNHLLVHMTSNHFRCVFSISKVATKVRQRSVQSGNEANRINTNIKRPTVDSFAPVGSLYMSFLVKRTGNVCKPNWMVRFTLRDKT